MTDTVDALPVITRRHRWKDDEDPRPVRDEVTGIATRKRQCIHCLMTRVTVIPPSGEFAWHEWIMANGDKWVGEATPPCVERGGA